MEAFDLVNPLTLIVLLPLLASFALMFVAWMGRGKGLDDSIRTVNMGLAVLIFGFTTLLGYEGFSDTLAAAGGFEGLALNEYLYENCDDVLTNKCTLIGAIGVNWHVGIDALSFPMVWLTTLLIPIAMLVQWDAKNGAYFHSLILMMEGALLGVFVSLDLFVFYVFWELTLVPMFFLILLWGGDDRRYAAQKFFIYTFVASVLMLAGILIMYANNPVIQLGNLTGRSFDLELMALMDNSTWLGGRGMQHFVFLLLLVGFATKMPSVPVHTWLPDAHVQAPTAGSMLLAGVMLKMGAYGFIRLSVALFPASVIEFTWLLVLLGMISLVYGAIVCLGQTNLKRMVAYSSVSHMGLIFLGVATLQPIGIAGAIFMMFAHGLISPLLFAVCGAFKHHYHTLEIGAMRGLARHSPWMAAQMMVGWMASLGLPLMAGFVAEVAIMIGFWLAFGWWVMLPALTLIITAAYYLWSMQRTIFEGGADGILPDSLHGEDPVDITWHENAGMLLLGVLTVLFGILPWFFGMFDMMSAYSTNLVTDVLAPMLNELGVMP